MTRESRLIKKYPNRRLYDMETSSYIKLGDVKNLVLEQVAFRIVDARTNEDLTRSVLLQVIVEQEGAAAPIFSPNMLSQIIRFYGDTMQEMMATYLETNIHTFIEIQRRLQEQSLAKAGDNPTPDPKAWSQFVKAQEPAIQGLMTSHLEQSAQTFLEMQQQFQKQADDILSAFQFPKFAKSYPAIASDEEPKPAAESDKDCEISPKS